ncbi:glycosyl hydrolase family 28-related protein [Priestia endophytica]
MGLLKITDKILDPEFLKRILDLERTPNTESWKATEGQTTFTLTNGKYLPNHKIMWVFIDGVKQEYNESYVEDSPTTFTLAEPVEAGTTVEAAWVEPKIPATVGHKSTHGKGGQDEINVSELAGYKEKVEDNINIFKKRTSNAISVEEFGAKGDGIQDDSTFIQSAIDYQRDRGGGDVILMSKHLINKTVYLRSNVKLKGTPITTIKSTSKGTLFDIPASSKNTCLDNVTVDYESLNSSIALLINENVSELKISNLTFKNFKNLDPAVHQNIIKLRTGISGTISNISFYNIKTIGNGTITDAGGAGRCIRTDSYGVTDLKNYSLNIDNVVIEDCFNIDTNGNMIIEDFDPIHFQHHSDVSGYINLTNVRAKNFSKRLIKIQGEGVNISNIIAESNIYVPWLIASMSKNCNISNINARGNIRTVIEFLDSSNVNVENINIQSTYTGSAVTDCLFNFHNSSKINISQVIGKGYGGFLFYGDITEDVSIDKVNLELSAQILFMQDRNAANTAYTTGKISNVSITKATFKVSSTAYNSALFAIDGLGSVNPISEINFRDVKLITNQLYQYGLLRVKNASNVSFDNLYIENKSTLTNPTLLVSQGTTNLDIRKLAIKGTATTSEMLIADSSKVLLTRSTITTAQLSGTSAKLELEKTPATVTYSSSATSAQVTIS